MNAAIGAGAIGARLSMGALLLAEIVEGAPLNPGREWWLLLRLALDADDTTRRTMPGYEFMAEQMGAPRSTVYRWLASLHEQGILRTVEHSAGGRQGTKGRRAVYEIQVPSRLAARVAQHLSGPVGGDSSPSTDRSRPVGPDP